jgi:hypothetical protein
MALGNSRTGQSVAGEGPGPERKFDGAQGFFAHNATYAEANLEDPKPERERDSASEGFPTEDPHRECDR